MTKKILVIPKGFFGDMVLTTPVFEAFRRGDSGVHVTVVVPPSVLPLAKSDPYIDDVIVFDRRKDYPGWGGLRAFARLLRERGFDRAYSFQRSPRTSLLLWMAGIKERVGYSDAHLGFLYTRRAAKISRHHEVIRNLEVIKADLNEECRGDIDALVKNGPAPVSQLFSLRIPECQPENISESVSNYIDGGPYVVLSPGSAWETKRWHAKGFREVAEALVAKNRRVLIVGAPPDSAACDEVCANLSTPPGSITNMCAKTSLVELMHLIRCSTAVICNDSLALHIGSATKVPTVAIFCATSPLFGFGPWRNRAIVVEKGELFCKPCRRHGSRKCPNGTNACMVGISSSEVIRAFDELFADETAKRGASLRIV